MSVASTLPDPRPGAFRPPAWLRNPHAQTVVGHALRRRCRFRYVRRRIETLDGDFLDLDGAGEDGAPAPSAPACLVLHGLEGSSASGYVARTTALLLDAGIHPFVLNFRSCSGEPNRRLRSYHSGATGDIRLVAERLAEERPGAPLGAIGYSLGGNALLCRLSETEPGFDAAVAVSVPYDLAGGAACLERGAGRMYGRWFLGSLKRKIREKAGRYPEAASAARAALRARTIREIDEAWTAPIHGFDDASHYYAACSSLARLPAIRTPTLLLQAVDDPFVPSSTPAAVEAIENPVLVREFSPQGGHLGYVSADAGRRLWAEARAVEWIAGRLARA